MTTRRKEGSVARTHYAWRATAGQCVPKEEPACRAPGEEEEGAVQYTEEEDAKVSPG